MQRLAQSLLVLFALSFSVFSQIDSSELKTVELFSSMNPAGRYGMGPAGRYCFSFVTESFSCAEAADIYYGNLRVGNDWDWFQIRGEGSRNKIKSLGKKKWTDSFKIPVVEPYAKLKEGERRKVVVDASGQDGRDGSPGRNGDGTINSDPDETFRALSQMRAPSSRETSNYKPFEKAILGSMYVMRVVDENNDFYVLFRVDELKRGIGCKISWKRIEAPKKNKY